MKAKVKIKSKNNINKEQYRLLLLENMLLNEKADLISINRNVRINNPSLYIITFRSSREQRSAERYMRTLSILYSDISACKASDQKEYLQKIFKNYIDLSPFSFAPMNYLDIYCNLGINCNDSIIFADSKNDCMGNTSICLTKMEKTEVPNELALGHSGEGISWHRNC